MNIERLKNFFKKEIVVDIAIFFLLALLSLSWFRGNNLINGGDFGMPLDWIQYFKSMSSVWMEAYSLGAAAPRGIASIFPYATFGALMQSLGFSLVFIEKIFFYVWFAGSGLSMYFLCSVLGMKRLGKLTASIFFMLNPFSLIIVWRVSHALIQMPYCFAPLYLALYIYGLKKKKGLGYIFLFVLAWILTTVPAYAWPAALAIHLIPIFFYFVLSLIYFSQERTFILKFTLKLALVFFGLNFYWLFPFIYSISESITGAHSQFFMNDLDTLKLTSVKIVDSIRLLGYWALHGGYKGDPYHPYETYYNSSLIIIISWLTPIMVLLGFFNKESRRKPLLIFFIATIVFGLIGMAGPYSPLGGLLIGLYNAFPSLALLTRFTILFFGIFTYTLFAVLVGYGFLYLYDQGKKILGKFILIPISIISILLFVVLVWPFWTGDVIKNEVGLSPGERVQVPAYWWQAGEWIKAQKDFFRILPLPMSRTYNVSFAWEQGYGGGDITHWLLDKPTVNVDTGESFKIPYLIGSLIEEEKDFKDVGKILRFLDVKYLLFREDSRWNYLMGHTGWFNHNSENINKFIKNQKDLVLEKKFDKLSFFKIKENLLPRIYSPESLVLIDGKLDSLVDVAPFLDDDKKEMLLFTDQISDKNKEIINTNQFEKIFIWSQSQFLDEKTKTLSNAAVYNFNIYQKGEYEIFLRNDDLLKNYLLKDNSLSISIDNVADQKVSLNFTSDNLISLGKIAFERGTHKIDLLVPPTINLISDHSFEESTWYGPVDVYPKDPGEAKFSIKQSPDASEGKSSLMIKVNSHTAGVYTPINNYKIGNTYQVSFATKHISGDLPYFAIWESDSKSFPPSMDFSYSPFGKPSPSTTLYIQAYVKAADSWKKSYLVFQPKENTSQVGVFFLSFQRTPGETINLFDDVRVERAFTNPMTLKLAKDQEVKTNSPEISFEKINSSKYQITVAKATQPFFLVFSESFHSQWKPSIEADQFLVNGFANGWLIKKQGDYKFNIEFSQQKIYYFSIGVSLAALFLTMGYLGYMKFKSRER